MVFSTMRMLPFLVALLSVLGNAHAGVLYKSIERDGRVTFADQPVEGAIAVQRIALADTGGPQLAQAEPSVPKIAMASDNDARIAQANAKVDMAERALAMARRDVWAENEGLTLVSPRRTQADRERIEFYKREALQARKELMVALKARNAQPRRTELAGSPIPAS